MRRFGGVGRGQRPHSRRVLPDLILVDGGKGQLSTAIAALPSYCAALPIVALAKGREAVFVDGSDAELQHPAGGTNSPAHDHTTWAVIVGMEGKELNRLYDPAEDGGVAEKDQFVVEAGTGLALMPDDLHSIHIDGTEPVLNFHMYGLALEQLEHRRYYKPETGEWKHFPASEGIRDLPLPA